MKKGIAIAGNLIVDYIKKIDTYPKEGMLSNVKSIGRSIGGCAGNTLVDLAKIDGEVPLVCYGKVGADENGQYIINQMKQYNIDIQNVITAHKAPTSFTDVMFSLDKGERTFFHNRGANAEFNLNDIDFCKADADFFHIGYALLLDKFDQYDEEYGTVMARALATAQKHKMRTSIDVVSEAGNRYKEVVAPAIKYCDYIIINEIEAGRVVDINPREKDGEIIIESLYKICKKFFELGVGRFVVLHMPELSCAMNASHEFIHIPACDLPEGFIQGTVGAGDAFCAGMLYALYNDWDISDAIQFSNAAAACSLTAEDAVSGMRTKKEIETFQNQYQLRSVL